MLLRRLHHPRHHTPARAQAHGHAQARTSGVAVRPVPMAHTGSYAITTSFIISALMPLRPAVSCVSHTLKVSPLSRSSLSSPMQLGEEGKEERGGERRRRGVSRRPSEA